jgi:hypothetical protein
MICRLVALVVKRDGMEEKPTDNTTDMLELLVSTFATAEALSKLLIEKGVITQQEFLQKISEERATYQKLLNPTPH